LEPHVRLTSFLDHYVRGDEGFLTRYCAPPNSLQKKISSVSTTGGRRQNISAVVC